MTNWNRRDRRHTTFHRHYFHAIRWSGGPGPGPSDIGYEPPVRPRARCRSAREPGSLYPKPRTRDASHRDWFSPKLCPDLPMTADATPRRKASAARHAKAPASHRQRGKQRAPTSCAPRPGWRWLAHSYGVRFLYLPTNSQSSTRKLLRLTIIDRAPGEIISDKLFVYRLDFLLRRGARGLRGLPCAGGVRVTPAGRAMLRIAGACRPETTIIGRAPGEILPFQLIVETQYFPFKAGRADFSVSHSLSARWRESIKQLLVVWAISYSSSRARVPSGTRTGLCLP